MAEKPKNAASMVSSQKKSESEKKEEQKSKSLADIDSISIPKVGGKQKSTGFKVPSISSQQKSQRMTQSMGQKLISQIHEFELKIQQDEQEKKREELREKEKKVKFTQMMTNLGEIKKETLQNQDQILDLEHNLKLKKIETRHLSLRIKITYIVIFILGFLLALQCIMALTGTPQKIQEPISHTKNETEQKTVQDILEETKNSIVDPQPEDNDDDFGNDNADDDCKNQNTSSLSKYCKEKLSPGERQKIIEVEKDDPNKKQSTTDTQYVDGLDKQKQDGPKTSGSSSSGQQVNYAGQSISAKVKNAHKNKNLDHVAYQKYLQNLYLKTYQLHRVLVAGASNLMEEAEQSQQTEKVKQFHENTIDTHVLHNKIYYHFSELYELQLKAVEAYQLGSKIDSRNPKTVNRTDQSITSLQTIHSELVIPCEKGDHLPMLSENSYLSTTKVIGMQRILQSLQNKFKKFSTREQYMAIQAAIKEYKSAIRVDRKSFVESTLDSIQNLFSFGSSNANDPNVQNKDSDSESLDVAPQANASHLSREWEGDEVDEHADLVDEKLEFSDDL